MFTYKFLGPVVRVSGTSYHRNQIIMVGIAERGVGSRWMFFNAETGQVKVLPKAVEKSAVAKDSLFTDGFYMLRHSFDFKNCKGDWGPITREVVGAIRKFFGVCEYEISKYNFLRMENILT